MMLRFEVIRLGVGRQREGEREGKASYAKAERASDRSWRMDHEGNRDAAEGMHT